MEKEYIILYRGCGTQQNPLKLTLGTKNTDSWDENRIKALTLTPQEITSVIVGPRTVFEFYESGNFVGHKYRVINASDDKIRTYRFGCFEDHEIWRGSVKSFIIWTYDHYDAVHGIQYCDSDTQCKPYELCMCKDGQTHPSWCPKTKRRCVHGAYFFHEAPVNLDGVDRVDQECLMNEFDKAENTTSSYALNNAARKCAKDKINNIESKGIEGFSYYANNDAWVATICICISFICLLMACQIIKYKY